ncbi:MAG: hypothetical protein ACC667_05830 [Longimicrobiales bacterium]
MPPRSVWVVVLASPFGRHLVVVGIFLWLFLHAVASSIPRPIGFPASPWVNTVWVVAMTVGLLAVELRRKRLTDFFAALGLSGIPLWGAALIGVGILEAFLWAAVALAGRG